MLSYIAYSDTTVKAVEKLNNIHFTLTQCQINDDNLIFILYIVNP